MNKQEELAKLRSWLASKHSISLAEFNSKLQARYQVTLKEFLDENYNWAGLGIIHCIITEDIEEEILYK